MAALFALAAPALVFGIVSGARSDGDGDRPARLVIVDGSRRLADLPVSAYSRAGAPSRALLAGAVRRKLGRPVEIRRGNATIRVEYELAGTVLQALRLGGDGGRVRAASRVLETRIDAPILRQAQKNTCESAALEILLATRGVRIDQAELQASLPRSGPLDPQGEGVERVWGDPDLGYVGRPDGGGAAGGFGVYPGPVADLAARRGVRLEDLTGRQPSDVYARLRQGRAVMAWIGLSDGPYGVWRTPSGREVEVNFGEHTVVLTGIEADGSVRVSNPLEGTAETWSRATFEQLWSRLGRRALAA